MELKQFQISFCTVSMNRLHHLKQTLPKNIEDNEAYENLQFIILDYNSTDGLEDWVKSNMQKYIDKKKLKYYKTTEPTLFQRAHSTNLLFKLASGEILCKVDADNYTGKDFAHFINQQFNLSNNIFLTAIDFNRLSSNKVVPSDAFGRVCFHKNSFLSIKGYTEAMTGHGFDDYDFTNRLELAGFNRVLIKDPHFLKAITHDDSERIGNEFINKNLEDVYFSYLNPAESIIIFFYKNGIFEKGTIRDNSRYKSENYYYAFKGREFEYEYSLKENNWAKGRWQILEATKARLIYETRKEHLIIIKADGEIPKFRNSKLFFKLKDRSIIEQLSIFNTQLTNRNIMLNNWHKKNVITNKKQFGKGTVYLNFENDFPILIN